MSISQPFISFESPTMAARAIPAGFSSLTAVFALAAVLFVVMLAAAPGITRICTPPRAGTPVHLAR
jgi:hypothetical protein